MSQIFLADYSLRHVPTLPVFFFLNIISTKMTKTHLFFSDYTYLMAQSILLMFFNIHDRQSHPLGCNSLSFQVRFLPNDQSLRCLAHQLQHTQVRKIEIDEKQGKS